MTSSSSATTTTMLPTTTAPQHARQPLAAADNAVPETTKLGNVEQFFIGIISGGLSALGFSPVQWILYIVVAPSIVLELWEMYQIAYNKNVDMTRMRQVKRLRQQQFGHGVISGSGVSKLVADLLSTPTVFTALHCIAFLCISLCWTILWTLPNLHILHKTVALPQQQQKQILPTSIPSKPPQKRVVRKSNTLPHNLKLKGAKSQLLLPRGDALGVHEISAPPRVCAAA